MTVFRILALILLLSLISACSEQAPDTAISAETTGESSGSIDAEAATAQSTGQNVLALHQLFEEYFEGYLELNPTFATFIGDNRFNDQYANDIGPEWLAAAQELEQASLDRLMTIDATLLNEEDLLNYEIFKAEREMDLRNFDFADELMPLNQFRGVHNSFVQLGSGSGLQPFETVQDYDNFRGRVDGFVVWMQQAQTNMQQGIEVGLTVPRVLMENVIPQLESQLVDTAENSGFYQPIRNMPESFSAEDRERLTLAYTAAIEDQLIPAYREMRDFINEDYLAAARETHGMNALPGGAERYEFLVKQTTTTDLGAEEIHAIGLREVARIHEEMKVVMQQVGFEGNLNEFFDFLSTDPKFYYTERQALLDGYIALRQVIDPNAPKLFKIIPKADFEIRLVEPFREKSAAGGQYRAASPDGSRKGVFFANAYDLSARPKWAMESLYLHEAVPGHHFQVALTLELTNLPRFRQFGSATAYSEGWGLYAESLGKGLGAYTDPYQYFGKLNAELWRSIRLVVDTGFHYFGWTREEVLDYMYANSPVSEASAVSEAERFMAIPSQALAYKIGQLKIQELRDRAELALGDEFDIREFHAQVLGTGRVPLSVLEAQIDRWIGSSQTN
ncbi:MAG: DUF885 domain-containing protein [Xanthomonadales bacterium]|nr:DUF885 domain-containing protein [Xanthomonadales bacterium]